VYFENLKATMYMKLALLFSLLFLSIAASPSIATTHTIRFGPGYYFPATLQVAVGDTVAWQADDSSSFAAHPLESYMFPAYAMPVYVNTGTRYEYPVTMAGTYKYRCQLHWTNGMLGEFTAGGTPDTSTYIKHVIRFGPGYYDPDTLKVEVGDTIMWQADDSSSFAGHPLESYSFPAGASAIYVNTGTTFEYVVMVEGTYKYRCQLHWQNGMLGQFSTEDDTPDTATGMKHVIMFGPGYYSPSTLKVEVGDTIKWQADDSSSFAMHPLESYDFPVGATPIYVNTGTTYEYVVMVPGTYRYRCQFHWQNGMLGEFTTEDIDTSTSDRKHIITFDEYFYSPSFFSGVAIGDTIEWRGDFAEHPLRSLTVPIGAATFSQDTGTVFQYIVTQPGRYNYACAIHGLSHNMVGSFSTLASGVKHTVETAIQPYPNPTGSLVRIPFELATSEEITLTLHDITGREVHRIVKQFTSGKHEVEVDLSAWSTGSYIYRLTGDGVMASGQLMLAR
jgi:plastocyanin